MTKDKPSSVTDRYWLFADRKKDHYPKPTSRSGKWLVFVNVKDVDEVWEKIRKATEDGLLGFDSKVATAKLNPNASNSNQKVVCVYTYDWKDEEDVRKISEELTKLGITNKIPYKADIDTLAGKYGVRGDRNISKYYE